MGIRQSSLKRRKPAANLPFVFAYVNSDSSATAVMTLCVSQASHLMVSALGMKPSSSSGSSAFTAAAACDCCCCLSAAAAIGLDFGAVRGGGGSRAASASESSSSILMLRTLGLASCRYPDIHELYCLYQSLLLTPLCTGAEQAVILCRRCCYATLT